MPRLSFYDKEIKRNYHEAQVGQEKLYFSLLMDLANREIIAYNFSTRPKFSLVKTMLEQGLSRLKPTECPIIHSDQGVLYGSAEWVKMLEGKVVQKIEPSAIPSSIFKLTNLSNFWGRITFS
jgi:transposase InsO family protein